MPEGYFAKWRPNRSWAGMPCSFYECMQRDANVRRIPRWVKVAHTSFVLVLVPVYWRQYGPGNFLWFSDVALLTAVPALWLEHRLFASAQAVAILAPDTLCPRFWYAAPHRKQQDRSCRLY